MNYCSGIEGKYLRNSFPLHIINDNCRIDNVFIRKISERDFWNKISGKIKKYYVNKGNEYLGYVWRNIPISDSYIKYFSDSKINNTIYHDKRNALGYLTVAECIENNGKYINDIIDGIFSICEETSWVYAGHLHNCSLEKKDLPVVDDISLDLGAAYTAGILSFVYGSLKDKLDMVSDVICQRIEYEIEKRVFRSYLDNDDWWWLGFNTDLSYWQINNWNPYINYYVIYSSLVVLKDRQKFFKIINRAISSLDVFVDRYPDDGASDEGVGYWYMAAAKLFYSLELLDHMIYNKSTVWENKKIHNMMKYITNMNISNNKYVSIADSHPEYNIDYFTLFDIGEAYKDNELKYTAVMMQKQNGVFNCEAFSEVQAFLSVKYCYDIENLCSYTDNFIKKSWLPGVQILNSHETEKDGEGLFLCAKGGNNLESHNHNDIGEFCVYKNSNPVAIDVGVGVYDKNTFGENRYKNWFTNGLHHNIPIIDGVYQKEGMQYFAKCIGFDLSDNMDFVKFDLKNAYKNSDNIHCLERYYELNRNSHEVVIKDTFEFSKPMTYDSIVIFKEKPVETSRGLCVCDCDIEINSNMKYNISIDELIMDDEIFKRFWGDRIYKMTIHIAENTSGSIEMRFS